MTGLEAMTLDQFVQQYWWVLVLISLWTIPWKGYALWKAAENKQIRWFIALLLVNTVGILEITYIFYFSKPRENNKDDTNASVVG